MEEKMGHVQEIAKQIARGNNTDNIDQSEVKTEQNQKYEVNNMT